MKKNVYFLSFVAVVTLLSSCSSDADESECVNSINPDIAYNIVQIDSLYSINIPKFMSLSTTLEEGVSLQYSNPFKEKYVTVLVEEKNDVVAALRSSGNYKRSKSNLKNYVERRLILLADSGILMSGQTVLKNAKINGLDAYSIIVEGAFPNHVEVAVYFLTFIEGEDNFYLIRSWTLLDRKDAFIEEADVIAKSFREL